MGVNMVLLGYSLGGNMFNLPDIINTYLFTEEELKAIELKHRQELVTEFRRMLDAIEEAESRID